MFRFDILNNNLYVIFLLRKFWIKEIYVLSLQA